MGRVAKRRRPAALLIGLALALLALALLTGACGGDGDTGDVGDTATTTDRQGERRADARIFTWQSSDGVEIEAELRRGGEEWVLLGHQYTGSRRDWDQMVEGFVARGYTVLIWDFRCHGESGCNTVNNSKREATKDAWREWIAALDYAIDNGARVIHAGGASMGGTSLIQVAADRDDVASIFAISSPNRFQGLDALENYDRVTVPKLFIVGAGDTAAPDFSQRYFDRATGPARLNVLDTDLHGNTLAKDPVWGPIVQAMLYAFIEDSESYVAAGAVNNLTRDPPGDDEAEAESGAAAEDADSDDASGGGEQGAAEPAEEEEDGIVVGPLVVAPPPSGYALALIAPGDGGDQLVVVDPLAPDDYVIRRQFIGEVLDIAWLPTGPAVLVGQADQIVIVNLTTDPPSERAIPTNSFLPAGIAADFFEMALSTDAIVLSFAVVPDDVVQAPSTPALVNLLGPTFLAPYAGQLSDTPSQAALFSPDSRQLLSREVGALVLLGPATLEVVERFAAPQIVDARDLCVGSLCIPVEYDTTFPDEYGWLQSSTTGVFWARYSNKLYLRLADESELTEWLTLPGLPVDVAVSPQGTEIAWVSGGPPEGTNALFLSDLDTATSTLLLQDKDLVFFDVQWSPDARYIAFTSVVRGDASSLGVLIVDTETGDVIPVGPGCCAEWAPVVSS